MSEVKAKAVEKIDMRLKRIGYKESEFLFDLVKAVSDLMDWMLKEFGVRAKTEWHVQGKSGIIMVRLEEGDEDAES